MSVKCIVCGQVLSAFENQTEEERFASHILGVHGVGLIQAHVLVCMLKANGEWKSIEQK